MMQFLKMRWLFNRRFWMTFLYIFALCLVAFTVNVMGIRMAGSIQSWTTWIKDHALIFLLWRCVLYLVAGYGWYWMHKRMLEREGTPQAKNRLIRMEVSALCALLVLEISHWFA